LFCEKCNIFFYLKQARLREKKEQEDLLETQRLQAEKIKREKLLTVPLPQYAMTKASEHQLEKVIIICFNSKIRICFDKIDVARKRKATARGGK